MGKVPLMSGIPVAVALFPRVPAGCRESRRGSDRTTATFCVLGHFALSDFDVRDAAGGCRLWARLWCGLCTVGWFSPLRNAPIPLATFTSTKKPPAHTLGS